VRYEDEQQGATDETVERFAGGGVIRQELCRPTRKENFGTSWRGIALQTALSGLGPQAGQPNRTPGGG
jgi:hypothetical protein